MTSEAICVTIKVPESAKFAGDNPWFVFKGEGPDVRSNIIRTFSLEVDDTVSLAGVVIAAQTTVTGETNASRGGLTSAPPTPLPEPASNVVTPQVQAWGAAPQQQAPSNPNAQLHPAGKACHCGKVLEYKTSTGGKAKWQCPEWRWNGGNPNNHGMEWANQR